jgi:hypothetical protein
MPGKLDLYRFFRFPELFVWGTMRFTNQPSAAKFVLNFLHEECVYAPER